MTCYQLIISDLSRISKSHNLFSLIKFLFTNPSFKITFWFRIGSLLSGKIKMGGVSILYSVFYVFVFFIHKHNQYLTGIQIPFGTKVGQGLSFSHFSCVVINSGAVIGDNCTIFQGVTIGSKRGGGVPVIGNNCVITAGAKIIGNVKIGNYVVVGANSVVVKDIPDNAVVGGIPAKVLNMDGVKTSQLYFQQY